MSQIPTISRPARLDRLCAEAVELARAAAEETGEGVGEYLHAEPEADRVVTHFFESTLSGYQGWRWAVVVARAPRSRTVTVNETALLPGPDALSAPDWLPWAERLRAGDVGVGDLLPTDESDTRLMPAYTYSDDDAVEDISYELGVGRTRVMSREGRIDTAERWYDGEHGPDAEISTSAPAEARCGGCGFYLPLAGSLRQLFGVCGNMFASDDAMVVSSDHGCGAHSEVLTQIDTNGTGLVDRTDTAYDDALIEQLDTGDDEDDDEFETDAADTNTDADAEATGIADAAPDVATAEVAEPEAITVEVTETRPEADTTEAGAASADVAVVDTAEVEAAPAAAEAGTAESEAVQSEAAATDTAGPDSVEVEAAAAEPAAAPSEASSADALPADAVAEVASAEAAEFEVAPSEALPADADVTGTVQAETESANTQVGSAPSEPDADEPEVVSVAVETASEVNVTVPRDEPVEVAVVAEPEAPAAVTVTEPVEATSDEADDTPEPATEATVDAEPAAGDSPTAEPAAASSTTADESVPGPESGQVSPAADDADSGRETP